MSTDTTRMFYPKAFGMDKAEALQMISERIQDGTIDPGRLGQYTMHVWLGLLDDDLMQDFVNAWYNPVHLYMADEIVPASRNDKMEQALLALHDALSAKLHLKQI